MRRTHSLKLVMAALRDTPAEGRYGYNLARLTGLKSGTVQPILQRLLDAQWVTAYWEPLDPHGIGRPPRKLYDLTDTGRAALADILEKP